MDFRKMHEMHNIVYNRLCFSMNLNEICILNFEIK